MRKYWGTRWAMVFRGSYDVAQPVMRIGNQIMIAAVHVDVTKSMPRRPRCAAPVVGIPEPTGECASTHISSPEGCGIG